jgi:hypothetical protein
VYVRTLPGGSVVPEWALFVLAVWLLALALVWSLLRAAARADRAAEHERAQVRSGRRRDIGGRIVEGRWEGPEARVGDRLALALALVHSAASEVEPATPAARQLRDAEATLGRARALVSSRDH